MKIKSEKKEMRRQVGSSLRDLNGFGAAAAKIAKLGDAFSITKLDGAFSVKEIPVKVELKKKPEPKEKPLFGERDEAINTLTLEVRLLTEELEFTRKRIATYEGNAIELEQRIENLSDLLKEVKKS